MISGAEVAALLDQHDASEAENARLWGMDASTPAAPPDYFGLRGNARQPVMTHAEIYAFTHAVWPTVRRGRQDDVMHRADGRPPSQSQCCRCPSKALAAKRAAPPIESVHSTSIPCELARHRRIAHEDQWQAASGITGGLGVAGTSALNASRSR